MDKKYKLQYLPIFEKDLEETVLYISETLQNPQSANNLIEDVEKAVLERLKFPLSFEPFHSSVKRKNIYYKIKIRNYYVFYVVIDDVMEVRRLIYSRRNIDEFLI